MNANDLRQGMESLYRIDRDQFVNTLRTIDEWPHEIIQDWWRNFKSDPLCFYVKAPVCMSDALFALIQKHLDTEKDHD